MLRGFGFFLLVLCVVSLSFLLRKGHESHEKLTPPTVATEPVILRAVTSTPEKIQVAAQTPAVEDSAVVEKKISTLNEILKSKNDNDPRLDSEFKKLTPEEKDALRSRFSSFKHERFNERGTIVFLLGRNISSEKDVNFLKQVLLEPPCLSMTRCTEAPAKGASAEADHLGSVNSVTLAYPQIVSIKSMENFLGQSSDPTLKALAMESLRAAAHSKSATVAELAASTLNRINSNTF